MIGSYKESILKQPSYKEKILTERYLLFNHLNQKLQKDIFGNLTDVYMAYLMLHWNGIQELKTLWIVTPEQYPKLIHHSSIIWYHKCDELIAILVHVDNFLFAWNKDFYKKIITELRGKRLIEKEDKLNFKYLGLDVTSTNSTITLNQYQYIQNLPKIKIHTDRNKEPTSTLNKAEKDLPRAKIGHLLWISYHTRLDISLDVSSLASNLNNVTVNEILYCNKVISKVYHNSYQLN